jgi:hypothetical protein
MGVGLDGANLYIRQEGWKELKVGCVFEVELRPIFEPETGEWLEQGHAINNSYVAYLGGPLGVRLCLTELGDVKYQEIIPSEDQNRSY